MELGPGDVVETRYYYSKVGIWPTQPDKINPTGWLSNFDEDDLPLALHLLDNFLYLDRPQTMRMSESAFHNLSADIEAESKLVPGVAWNKFRSDVLVSYPAAKVSDPTASGRVFIRQAKESALLPEGQFFDPSELVAVCAEVQDPPPVVLLDDLAATGSQFATSILARYETSVGLVSLFDLLNMGTIRSLIYIPTISTAAAKQRLLREFPGIGVKPAHVLPPTASVMHASTELAPVGKAADLQALLVRCAKRAGYSEGHPYGYDDTGLALAFEHGVPDNTLPIFYADAPGWHRLIAREVL